MHKNYFILAFLFILSSANAQEQNNRQHLIKSINDYYSLTKENIFLHLNKSTYLTNETIWFKGYVTDKKTNKLNYETTNVYVRILDKDKKEITNKLFLADAGIIVGNFMLNEQFKSGTYFIHTYTNFMNNFEEDESSIFPIEIINVKDKINLNDDLEIKAESIDLSVDGGKLIYECDNTIGVRIKNCTGKGVFLKNIKVYDAQNNLVNQFSTNKQGYGKFEILKTKNEQYKLVFDFNNTKIEKKLPQVVIDGITMNVNNYSDKNSLYIKFKTNSSYFEKIKDDKFTLVIQKNNQVSLADFHFDQTVKEIFLEKSNLFKGLNTIRIIDQNNNLINERIIYNHVENKSKITLEKTKIKNDTLLFKGKLKSKMANFSISILPSQTLTSFEDNAIISHLNFNNYLLNNLEDYSYYFRDFNSIKQYELDLVMLNQNISKYNWNNILTKKPIIKYPFDKGITFEGTINQSLSKKDKYSINLFSLENGININKKIDHDNKYKFENIIAIDSTTLYVSLLNDNKYEKLYQVLRITNNKNKFLKITETPKSVCSEKIYTTSTKHNIDFPYINNTTILKEVVLVEKSKPELTNEKLYFNKGPGIEGYKIDKNKAGLYGDVISFISTHGYIQVTDTSGYRILNRVCICSPTIYIDDLIVLHANQLINMQLNDIDEIYIDRWGIGLGGGLTGGGGGTIRIYTKINYTNYDNIDSKPITIKEGFHNEIPFKNPIYYNYQLESFKKYGTIYWIPNLYTDEIGNFEFKIPTLNQESLLLNIQGIDNEGNLYYENIIIDCK